MTSEKKKKTEKTASKAAGKAASKAVGKTVDKAAGKTTGKAATKTAGKVASKAVPSAKEGKSSPPVPVVDWQAFIEKMEKTLTDSKAELIETLIANNKDFKEIVEGMDPKDFADSASDDVDRKMIEALGSQELKRLKLIDSALTRIKQGKYGHCIKCEKRIPPDRLEVLPYALMCIECKSEEERRNR